MCAASIVTVEVEAPGADTIESSKIGPKLARNMPSETRSRLNIGEQQLFVL